MDDSLLTAIETFNYSSIPPGGYTVRRHVHPFHQLDVILDGELWVHLEDNPPIQVQRGDALLIPPLVSHYLESPKGFRQGSWKFHMAPSYWRHFGTSFHQFKVADNDMENIEVVGQRYARADALAKHGIVAVATLCLLQCLESQPSAQERYDHLDTLRPQLWSLLERIERSVNEEWPVTRMAAECHLSPDYFSRCFHRIIGRTPQHYIVETRMRIAAVNLLAEPALPIKEIARRVNYSSVYTFSRTFKQIFGIPPGSYRTHSNE